MNKRANKSDPGIARNSLLVKRTNVFFKDTHGQNLHIQSAFPRYGNPINETNMEQFNNNNEFPREESFSNPLNETSQIMDEILIPKTIMNSTNNNDIASRATSFLDFDIEVKQNKPTNEKLLWVDSYDNGLEPELVIAETLLSLNSLGKPFILRPNNARDLSETLVNLLMNCLDDRKCIDGFEIFTLKRVQITLVKIKDSVHAFAVGVLRKPVLFVTWEKKQEILVDGVDSWMSRPTFTFQHDLVQIIRSITNSNKIISVMTRSYEALAVCYRDIPPLHHLIRLRLANVGVAWVAPNWSNYTKITGTLKCHLCGKVNQGVCHCNRDFTTPYQRQAEKRAAKRTEEYFENTEEVISEPTFKTTNWRLDRKKSIDISKEIDIKIVDPVEKPGRFIHGKVTKLGSRNVPSVVLANAKYDREREETTVRQKNFAVFMDRLALGKKVKNAPTKPREQIPKEKKSKVIAPPPGIAITPSRWEVDNHVITDLFGMDIASDGEIVKPEGELVAQGLENIIFPDEYPYTLSASTPNAWLIVEPYLDFWAKHSVSKTVALGALYAEADRQNKSPREFIKYRFEYTSAMYPLTTIGQALTYIFVDFEDRQSIIRKRDHRKQFKYAQGDPETGERTDGEVEVPNGFMRPYAPAPTTAIDAQEHSHNADIPDDPALDYDYPSPEGIHWYFSPISDQVRVQLAVQEFLDMASYVEEFRRRQILRLCLDVFEVTGTGCFNHMLTCMNARAVHKPDEVIGVAFTKYLVLVKSIVMIKRDPEASLNQSFLHAQGLLDGGVSSSIADAAKSAKAAMTSLESTSDAIRTAISDATSQAKSFMASYYTPVADTIKCIDHVFKWTDFVKIGLRFTAFARAELDWALVISFLVDTMCDVSQALQRAKAWSEKAELCIKITQLKDESAAMQKFCNSPANVDNWTSFQKQWNDIKFAQGLSGLFDNFLSVLAGLSGNTMKYLRNFNTVITAWRNAQPISRQLIKLLPECVRELFGLVNDSFMVTDEDYVSFTKEFSSIDRMYSAEPRSIMDISLKKIEEIHENACEYFRRATMCVTRGVNTVFLSYAQKRMSTIRAARSKVELLTAKRYNPMGILLYGAPGVGKSEIAKKIGLHYLHWANDPELLADETFKMMSKGGMYSFQSQLDFFDGYGREGVMIIDELGSRTDGEDLVNLFSLISNNTFIPPMASLDDDVVGSKGTPFTSHTVIACSNVSQFDHLNGAFITPAAINRRFMARIQVVKKSDGYDSKFSNLRFLLHGTSEELTLGQLLTLLKDHPIYGFKNHFLRQMTIDHGLIDLEPVPNMDKIFSPKSTPYNTTIKTTQGGAAEVALTLARVTSAIAFGFGLKICSTVEQATFTQKVVGWCGVIAGGLGLLLATYVETKRADDKEHSNIIYDLRGMNKHDVADFLEYRIQSGKGGGKSGAPKVRTVNKTSYRGRLVKQGKYTKAEYDETLMVLRAYLIKALKNDPAQADALEEAIEMIEFERTQLDPSDPELRRKLTQGIEDMVAMSVEDKAARALCRIEVWANGQRVIGMNAIPVGHIHFVAPLHLLEHSTNDSIIKIVWLAGAREFEMLSSKITVRELGEDSAVYSFNNLPWRAPSLFKNLVRESELDFIKECPVSLVTKNRGVNVIGIYSTIGSRVTEPDEYFGTNGTRYRLLKGFHYQMNTTFGDCGGPIICHDKDIPHKIVGFHVAGMLDQPYGMAHLLTYEEVQRVIGDDLMARTIESPRVAMGAIELVAYHKPILASNRRTNFFRTNIECFPEPKHPTDLRIHNGVDPVLNAMMKNATDRSTLLDVDDATVHLVAKHLLNKMERTPGRRIRTFREALSKIGSLDRVNLKSSPGYPYILKGRKTDYVQIDEEGLIDIKDPQIERDTERIINDAKDFIPNLMWTSCGKDECLKPDKACRIFEIPPFSFTMALRQYFGDFVSYVHANPMKFGSIVGLNPESSKWNELMLALRAVSTIGLAVDWKRYDSTLVVAAFLLLTLLANGWYDDGVVNGKIRANLINSSQSRMTVFEEFVLFILFGNPSGWMLTTIVNTFGQYLMFAKFWLEHAPAELRDLTFMDKHIAMFLYGDDGILSVSREVRYFFNFENMAPFFLAYGMTITSDAKDSGAAFMPVEELTILKRGFRKDTKGLWVPTMAWNTMFNMVNYNRKSKHSTPKETFEVVFRNFLVFLYFYGQEEYDRVTKLVGIPCPSWQYFNHYFYSVGQFLASIPE